LATAPPAKADFGIDDLIMDLFDPGALAAGADAGSAAATVNADSVTAALDASSAAASADPAATTPGTHK
jgi:hypothetical protein